MDYYCSTKFKTLQVNVQGRDLYNCDRASPERISIKWLEENPGRLFHTDTMVADRKLMLENKPCASCDHGCYKYERQGLRSARLQNKTQHNIDDPYAPMQNLIISFSTDCNLKCVYCDPEWSSAWQREIEKHGGYTLGGHEMKNNSFIKLWSKMKQEKRGTGTRFFSLLLQEIKLAKNLKSIMLQGGEPLLNNQLYDVINHIGQKEIIVTTGLGVNNARLESILEKIKGSNVKFVISAEATGKFFEFIRHGISWEDFRHRIKMIDSYNHEIKFMSTISNLSVFDLHNFYQYCGTRYPIKLNQMSERPFLAPHVLDEKSKDIFLKNIHSMGSHADELSRMISLNPSEHDRDNIGKYLTMLCDRRKLDINFLPKHFLDWCGLNG
jgi:hypothetical protein